VDERTIIYLTFALQARNAKGGQPLHSACSPHHILVPAVGLHTREEVLMDSIHKNDPGNFLWVLPGEGSRYSPAQRVSRQQIRRFYFGGSQEVVKFTDHVPYFAGLLRTITPAEPSAVVGAGLRRSSYSRLNLRPTGIGFPKPADEDDGWRSLADTEEVIPAAADIDQPVGWWIVVRDTL
jgi:hypothetical protein